MPIRPVSYFVAANKKYTAIEVEGGEFLKQTRGVPSRVCMFCLLAVRHVAHVSVLVSVHLTSVTVAPLLPLECSDNIL